VLAELIGKVALCVYLSRQFGRQLRIGWLDRPLIGFLFGWAVITALYLVPVLGGLTFAVVITWGLGAAVMAAFGGAKKERPQRVNGPTPTATATPMPMAAPQQATPPSGMASPVFHAAAGSSFATPKPEAASLPPFVAPARQPEITDPLLLPRAEFWPRLGAAFLDLVIVIFLSSYVHMPWLDKPLFPLVAVAYFAGLIAWKGTTAGGIVLNLKVVRLDGQPVVFAVALVRALAAWLSVAVLFLGFLWILWDAEKQAWHDKIAGTVVVRVPRMQPLL
jgi:uncharacterized RDD family membrane protein YckC